MCFGPALSDEDNCNDTAGAGATVGERDLVSDDPDDGNENDEGPPYQSLEALHRAEEQVVERAFRKLFGKYEAVATAVIGLAAIFLLIFSIYKVIFTELSDRSFSGFMMVIILFSTGILYGAVKGITK